MTIERKRPYGALSIERLAAFESDLPAPLPDDYRAFLRDFNGARFSSAVVFDDVPGTSMLESLFGLHDGPEHLRLDTMRRQSATSAPESLLIIGADPFGNYFGLSLEGPDRGAVYFIDHERMPVPMAELHRVAGSFSELLERAGGDLEEPTKHPSIAVAVGRGDLDAVKSFLRDGSHAAGTMHRAVRSGNMEVLRALLDAGGDPNERGGADGHETPLFTAAEIGRADMAELLIAHGADPSLRNTSDQTALDVAKYAPAVLAVLVRGRTGGSRA